MGEHVAKHWMADRHAGPLSTKHSSKVPSDPPPPEPVNCHPQTHSQPRPRTVAVEMGVRYTAEVSFLEKSPRYETEKPYLVLLPEGADVDPSIPLHNLKFEEKEVSVLDIRDCQSAYHLDECGFEYLPHTTDVTAILGDEPTVDHVNAYKAETEALLRQRFGAVKVVCYELRLRERKDFVRDAFDINDPLLVEGPALGAHTGKGSLYQCLSWANGAAQMSRRALVPR